MMKKLCALFLCMTMLLSLVTVAQADVTYPLVESFEDEEVGTIANGVVYRGESPIFGDTFYLTTATAEIVNDGYNGKCFKVTEQGGAWYQLGTEYFVSTAAEPVYVNFKLRIDNDANGTASLPIKLNGTENFIYIQQNSDRSVIWPVNDGGSRIPYTVGEWYDFTIKFVPGRADIIVKDKNGNVATGYRDTGVTGNDFLDFKGAGNANTTAIEGTGISLDEFYVTKGGSLANLVSSDIGTVPVEKTAIAEEDFNNGEIADLSAYLRSSVVNKDNGMWTSYVTHTMVDDCNGGYAPQLTGMAGKTPWINTISTPITATEKTFVSLKWKACTSTIANILSIGFGDAVAGTDGGYELRMMNGNFEPWNYWGRRNIAYTPDVWYTIAVEFQKVNDVDQATLYIYDDLGNEVMKRTPEGATSRYGITGAKLGIFQYAGAPTYCLDDIRILQTPAATDSEAFIKSELVGEKVSSTTPVITAEFDKAISADSTAKFVAGSTEIPAVVTVVNPITVEITPASALDYSTSYTLDLSGIKTNEDLGLAAGSTTSLAVNTPAYSLGTMTLGDVAISGTTLTVPVTFANAAYKEVYTNLIAALYDASGNLVWVDFQNVKGATMGANTFTFIGLPEGANVENIKIFAWDNFSSMMPLYR